MKIFKRILFVTTIVIIMMIFSLYMFIRYAGGIVKVSPELPINTEWNSTQCDISINTYESLSASGEMVIGNDTFQIDFRTRATGSIADIIFEDKDSIDNRDITILYASYKLDKDNNIILKDIEYQDGFEWDNIPETIILRRKDRGPGKTGDG